MINLQTKNSLKNGQNYTSEDLTYGNMTNSCVI